MLIWSIISDLSARLTLPCCRLLRKVDAQIWPPSIGTVALGQQGQRESGQGVAQITYHLGPDVAFLHHKRTERFQLPSQEPRGPRPCPQFGVSCFLREFCLKSGAGVTLSDYRQARHMHLFRQMDVNGGWARRERLTLNSGNTFVGADFVGCNASTGAWQAGMVNLGLRVVGDLIWRSYHGQIVSNQHIMGSKETGGIIAT